MNTIFKSSILTIVISLFAMYSIHAQKIRVIDNKGSIRYVNNNNVYSQAADPTLNTPNNVVENDIWFDSSDPNSTLTRIYNGTSWILLVDPKVNALQDADGDTRVYVENNDDDSDIIIFETGTGIGSDAPASTERMRINAAGNVGIGNTPNINAILDLTNSLNFAFLLPTETLPLVINNPLDGMLIYSSTNKNAYLRANNVWKPIAYNTVDNEYIFEDQANPPSAYYYVSLIVNGNWKVIRYSKTDVNQEEEVDGTGTAGQPITLAACEALTF